MSDFLGFLSKQIINSGISIIAGVSCMKLFSDQIWLSCLSLLTLNTKDCASFKNDAVFKSDCSSDNEIMTTASSFP